MDVISKIACPVCGRDCGLLDSVDFNKSCEEVNGKYLAPSGISISYMLCEDCGFCFAPEMYKWPLGDFEKKVYNEDYVNVDPNYVEARPTDNAKWLDSNFSAHKASLKHLDYGGGDGKVSQILKSQGWNSISYDPFVNKDASVAKLGKFDVITAFEVFEHVPDVNALVTTLKELLAPGGLVFFATVLSDGNIQKNGKLTWWYAAPRNGHISLFSKNSLTILANKHGFNCGNFHSGFHVFCTTWPNWAKHMIK